VGQVAEVGVTQETTFVDLVVAFVSLAAGITAVRDADLDPSVTEFVGALLVLRW
jgi:hypothetical protein